MNILIASEATKKTLPDYKWHAKAWVTRDGRTTAYWCLADDDVPAGFKRDDQYSWRVNGDPTTAYFTPDVLAGWQSKPRGAGNLSSTLYQRISYAQQRELNIYEKLERMNGPADVMPPVVRPVEVPAAFIARRKRLDLAYNTAVEAADSECQRAIDEAQDTLRRKSGAKVTLKSSGKMQVGSPKLKHLAKYNDAVADISRARAAAMGKALSEWRAAVVALEDEYNRPHGPLVAQPGRKILGFHYVDPRQRPVIAAS